MDRNPTLERNTQLPKKRARLLRSLPIPPQSKTQSQFLHGTTWYGVKFD